jgi:hypothetical protein
MATMKCLPVVLVLVCSCVVPDPDVEEVAVEEQNVLGTKPNCDETGCGMNSPYLDTYGFHFLYQDGSINPQGFRITAFERFGTPLTLKVVDGRITGIDASNVVYAETTLNGAKFHISYNGTPMFRIMINGYETMFSWAENARGQRMRVRTYRFKWETVSDPNKFYDLCSNPGVDETLGMNEHHTLVFEGDVIDANAKKVLPTINNNVINFGCAGGTLAKQHLTGHTEVAARQGFVTTYDERTTNLKMLSADYCGNGKAFTIGGQPLQWSDHRSWVDVVPPLGGSVVREALWSTAGAVCLNKPRLVANASAFGTAMYGNIETAIAATCTRPVWCGSGSAYQPDSGMHLVSSNPYP